MRSMAVEPSGTSPVNVAPVIFVALARTKSSADSISIFPALSGRDAVAISPSGSPVLKKNGAPAADAAHRKSAATAVAHRNTLKILDLGWKGIGPPLTLTSYLATRCTQQPYR
jgi:hypothetical protein